VIRQLFGGNTVNFAPTFGNLSLVTAAFLAAASLPTASQGVVDSAQYWRGRAGEARDMTTGGAGCGS